MSEVKCMASNTRNGLKIDRHGRQDSEANGMPWQVM